MDFTVSGEVGILKAGSHFSIKKLRTPFGFEPMTNKSPRHNFTAAPGLALNHFSISYQIINYIGTLCKSIGWEH